MPGKQTHRTRPREGTPTPALWAAGGSSEREKVGGGGGAGFERDLRCPGSSPGLGDTAASLTLRQCQEGGLGICIPPPPVPPPRAPVPQPAGCGCLGAVLSGCTGRGLSPAGRLMQQRCPCLPASPGPSPALARPVPPRGLARQPRTRGDVCVWGGISRRTP